MPEVKSPWWLALVATGIVMLLLVLTAHFAHAQHPTEHQALHDKFYSTWTMPDAPSVSCCHNLDCSPAASRLVNGHWEAERDGEWISVPENKIEVNKDSPDGRSHLCGRRSLSGFAVFCFVRGGGT